MRKAHTAKTERFAAVITAVVILFAVLLSYFYISAEACHECTGEECPVCAVILQCEKTLTKIGSAAVITATAIISTFIFIQTAVQDNCAFLQNTPISRKVRLNN